MSKFTGLQTIKEGSARVPEVAVAATDAKPVSKRSKKLGKRQDPNYQQISVYINTAAYIETRRKLLGTGQDFSELINRLIQEWNKA